MKTQKWFLKLTGLGLKKWTSTSVELQTRYLDMLVLILTDTFVGLNHIESDRP